MLRPDRITADPHDLLAHYALGDMPGYTAGEGSPVRWLRDPHRGVHLLANVDIPKAQRRYVFSPKFELRFDTAFEQVVRECASPDRTGHTWILPQLIEGYCNLHRLGFAHSFETWQDGQLVGGCFGVHIGAYVSVESMFYRVANASKAAYGRTLLHLKERGFRLVDSNPVADSSRNYGEEWIPRWRFEDLLQDAIHTPARLTDDRPAPLLPARVRRMLPVHRLVRKIAGKLSRGSST